MEMIRHRRDTIGADAVRQLDRRPAVLDPEAAAGERLLVDAWVQLAEAVAEPDLPAVDPDRAERRPDAGLGDERQVGVLGREKPAHARPRQLEEPGGAARLADVDLAGRRRAEQPEQQIEEVN